MSPVPPTFAWITNWSPAAGAPVICTRVPLMSMSAPGVYANEPAPLIVYVVALTNAIVLVVSKARVRRVDDSARPRSCAVPVFASAAFVRVGAAAAMSAGRVTSNCIVPATCSNGFK